MSARPRTDTAEAFVARRQARRITRLQNTLFEVLAALEAAWADPNDSQADDLERWRKVLE